MISVSPEKRTFQDLLREKDPFLLKTLENIKKFALEQWLPLIKFDKGTHTGYPHLINVERNADKLVPDHIKAEFQSGEIFLLLASIFLHDIGKIEDFKNHNKKSRKIIRTCWAELGLPDERIAEYCAILAFFHAEKPIISGKLKIQQFASRFLEPYGMLRLPMLAAILRIADETENCWKRTIPEFLKSRFQNSGVDLVKGFRRYIEDVEYCLEAESIIFHLPEILLFSKKNKKPSMVDESGGYFYINESERRALNRLTREIKEVLYEWRVILDEYNLKYTRAMFDYENHLYRTIRFDKRGRCCGSHDKLADLFQREVNKPKPGVQEIAEAILSLSMGSQRFKKFSWKILEAKVGIPLGDRERWLVRRINMVSKHLTVHIQHGEALSVEFSIKDIKKIRNELGY
jgi:hypothetical protein